MKIKTRGKLLMLIVSSLLLFSIAVNTIVYFQFNNFIVSNMLRTNANLGLKLIEARYPGEWRLENDKLYKGDTLINDNFEIVDTIKEGANVESTLFLKDTRISTTVTNNGVRAVGTKAAENVIKAVIGENKEYIGSAKVLNAPFKTIYIPIKDKGGSTIGMFFIGVNKLTIDQQVNKIVFVIISITVILILVMLLLVTILINRIIIKPIKYSKEHLGLLASGDLSLGVRQEYLRKSDEFGDMSKSIESMQNSIKDMLRVIKGISGNVDKQSDNLLSVSNEISSSSENVANSVQGVAAGAGSQAGDLMDISEILKKFAEELEIIVKAIKDVDSKSQDANSLIEGSNSNMQQLIMSVNSVNASFKDFVSKMSSFDQNVKHVNKIINVINSIADQTNLLALNASIEAARAGDAGRGFAVVADEIRKLAEQTKVSSESINAIIRSISGDTDTIVKTSKTMGSELNNQVVVINAAIDSFKKVINEMDAIGPEIEAVNLSAVKLNSDKDTIIEKIEAVASIAEEVSASSEEIAAYSEEVNASTREVAASAQTLTALTKEMIEQFDKFKI